MKRYWMAVSLVFTGFLALFLLVEYLNPGRFTDLGNSMQVRSFATALVGVGLLTIDVLLPIPSSLVMISNGALFGIAQGTLLSVLGSMSATALGFLIGRWGGPLLARTVSSEERSRANQRLEEWGWLAILITRPLPLLAETTIIMAGASTMSWHTTLLASLAGSLPLALLYAITGATAVTFNNVLLSFVLVLLMAGIFWFIGHRFRSVLIPKVKGEAQ